jgi:hypothetical protein
MALRAPFMHHTPKPVVTRICIIRHGETDWNAQSRYQGQADVPMNEVGRAQARRNAARVATATGRDTHAVIVLTRARVHRKDRRNDEGVTVLSLDGLNRHLRRLPAVFSAAGIADAVARSAALAVEASDAVR